MLSTGNTDQVDAFFLSELFDKINWWEVRDVWKLKVINWEKFHPCNEKNFVFFAFILWKVSAKDCTELASPFTLKLQQFSPPVDLLFLLYGKTRGNYLNDETFAQTKPSSHQPSRSLLFLPISLNNTPLSLPR